jgi:hypothetical protein
VPYLLKVLKGKEKRIAETLLKHGISATAAPIGEYVICDKPFQIEIIETWIFSTTEVSEEVASEVMKGDLSVLLPEHLSPGRIVAIISGDYAGQMALIKLVEDDNLLVHVLVEGRMYPLTVARQAVKAAEVSATWR